MVNMEELRDLFIKGEYFPLPDHAERIDRYKRNEKLVRGKHDEVFRSTRKK